MKSSIFYMAFTRLTSIILSLMVLFRSQIVSCFYTCNCRFKLRPNIGAWWHVGGASSELQSRRAHRQPEPWCSFSSGRIYGYACIESWRMRQLLFICTLIDDTNHKKEGFLINIQVYTNNSDAWSTNMFEILKEKKCSRLNCSRLFQSCNYLLWIASMSADFF